MAKKEPLNFEDTIVMAIVNEFFKPQPGYFQTANPDGSMGVQIVPQNSPALMVAVQPFEQRRAEILEKVIESFDVEAFAEQIAGKILTELKEQPNSYQYTYSRTPTKGEDLIRTRVIEKLADIRVRAIQDEETAGDE